MQALSCDARRHLSGDHVVPDEDEVDALVCSDAQGTLDALQVCCNVRKSGRLRPAVAAEGAQTHNHQQHLHTFERALCSGRLCESLSNS